MRVLAVDFGERRVGLAFGESALGVAVPVGTVPRDSDEKAAQAVAVAASEREAELLVVGEPRRLDGSESPFGRRARSFARRLEATARLPVVLHPETLTSVDAERTLAERGLSVRRRRAPTDTEAAAVLLRDWMEAHDRRPAGIDAPGRLPEDR